ncbi:MAG TPA: hypothetical protein VIV60_25995 [Polyangiaceae bacterium]
MQQTSSELSVCCGKFWRACLTATGGVTLALVTTACAEAPESRVADAAATSEEVGQTAEALVAPANAVWIAQGPAPIRNGQSYTWPTTDRNPVAGAVQAVAPHPVTANILYVGTVNGGVWKTNNALAQNPTWIPLTDKKESLSIGAIALDRTNANTVVAATGLWSSFGTSQSRPNEGVSQGQVLVSRDAGSTWAVYANALFAGQKASSVIVRGNTVVVGFLDTVGLVRSTDLGAHWTRISGNGTGLPAGAVDDVTEDIQNSNRLYLTSSGLGVFRSDDLGVSWVNISQNDQSDFGLDYNIRNYSTAAKVSVSQDGRAFVGIVGMPTHNGTTFVSYVGYTTNGGSSWTTMDPPWIEARGNPFFHFSLAADRSNSSFVYVAGDGDPVRGNTGAAPGTGAQWESLESTTPHNTTPHVDARDMVIDANLDLINACDGGVFRRVRPRENTGDWFSMAGNMQNAEIYSIAYDPIARVILAGSQDNGTVYQDGPNQLAWTTFVPDDGGDVQVDTISMPGYSIRYSSSQLLTNFTRSVWNATNVLMSQAHPALQTADGSYFQGQWITPIAINQANGRRIAIAAPDAVFESFDQGDHITSLGSAGGAQALAYGHPSNPEVLYAVVGNQLFVRLAANTPLAPATPITNCQARDLVMDPADFRKVYVLCDSGPYVTSNAGSSWTSITGNLSWLTPASGALRKIRYISGVSKKYVAVSADRGVYISDPASLGTWTKVGSNLPIAPVTAMQYSRAQDVLVVGTLGRGAWSVTGLGGP